MEGMFGQMESTLSEMRVLVSGVKSLILELKIRIVIVSEIKNQHQYK
jgi:hypothetical protein